MRGVVNAHLHTAAWINEYPEVTKEGLGKWNSKWGQITVLQEQTSTISTARKGGRSTVETSRRRRAGTSG